MDQEWTWTGSGSGPELDKNLSSHWSNLLLIKVSATYLTNNRNSRKNLIWIWWLKRWSSFDMQTCIMKNIITLPIGGICYWLGGCHIFGKHSSKLQEIFLRVVWRQISMISKINTPKKFQNCVLKGVTSKCSMVKFFKLSR